MFQPETVITAKVLKTGVWKELKHVATAASSFILLLTNWTCPPRPIKRCVVKTKPHPDCCFTVCVCGCSCLHNMFVLSVACASLNFNYQVVWPIRVPRFFKLGLQLTFYYPESSDNLCLTVQNTKIPVYYHRRRRNTTYSHLRFIFRYFFFKKCHFSVNELIVSDDILVVNIMVL